MNVRVKNWYPPGHVRTPYFLRGKVGTIERELGCFANPEVRAYGHESKPRKLLRVRFQMSEVWGIEAENPNDTIDAEIYEHWLEPANAP